ncbi:hypothetical protein DFJ73DRAFT_419615 [Zopfochytrium polystomum]|nr:hypothetical protein DFJ73DRAFT_419615 [Zopfochytrium polystomum]
MKQRVDERESCVVKGCLGGALGHQTRSLQSTSPYSAVIDVPRSLFSQGHLLSTFMRHSSAVRSFSICPDRPDRIICGATDGNITVWDLTVKAIVDRVIPDPEWVAERDEFSLVGWFGLDKHHSGSIMAVAVSDNGRLLVSAATDHTAKLWSIVSYMKDVDSVQNELRDANFRARGLDALIDVQDEKFDIQIQRRDFVGLRVGEVPIPMGYHADLVFTYRHEATVLAAVFNRASDIVITGSMDATCRLWSCRRGDLLFQINVPAPVSRLFVSTNSEDLYVVCQNRILVFGVQASSKEEDLPEYWQAYTPAGIPVQKREEDPAPIPEEMVGQKRIDVDELKQMISHGLVLPSFLDTLLEQYTSVDAALLAHNMKKFDLHPRQVLRLIVNSKFHPKDILSLLASRHNTEVVYSTILGGGQITSLMLNSGFRMISEDDKDERRGIFLNYRDFHPHGRLGAAPISRETRWNMYERRDGENGGHYYYPEDHGLQEDYDWFDGFDDDEDQERARERAAQRGKILHFIPSEQIKLLKDLQGKRDVKPVFMRQIMLEGSSRLLPNFRPGTELVDNRPNVAYRAVSKPGVRFNESSSRTLPLGFKSRPAPPKAPLQLLSQPNRGLKGSFSSSRTLFKPERYLRTRGLNVRFDDPYRSGTLLQGHVYAEPIVLSQQRLFDVKQQLVVGKSMALKEATIDEDRE